MPISAHRPVFRGAALFLWLSCLPLSSHAVQSTFSAAAPSARIERLTLLTGLPALTINDRLQGAASAEYRFRAKAGQTLRLKLLSDNADLVFEVLAPSRSAQADTGMPMLNEWERELSADGEYAVRVSLLRGASLRGDIATYALTLLLFDPNDGTLIVSPRARPAPSLPPAPASQIAADSGPPPALPSSPQAVTAPTPAPESVATATIPQEVPVPARVPIVETPAAAPAVPAAPAMPPRREVADDRAPRVETWEVTGVRQSDGVRVRAGPSTRHAVIGKLDRHAKGLRNLGCTVSKGQRWCKVASADGRSITGWVSADYLRRSEKPAPGK